MRRQRCESARKMLCAQVCRVATPATTFSHRLGRPQLRGLDDEEDVETKTLQQSLRWS